MVSNTECWVLSFIDKFLSLRSKIYIKIAC